MSKKILMVILLVLTLTNMQTVARDETQYFKIYADSQNSQEAYRVKNALIEEFQSLVTGLDESQYHQAIEANLAVNERQTYQANTIIITLGDGQGVMLSGTLEVDYCAAAAKAPLETHFFFWELFQ